MTDREMLDQWLVVYAGRSLVSRSAKSTAGDADAAVGYVYVDSMCGMTLGVEAWCKADADQIHVISRPSDTKQLILWRYPLFAKMKNRLLTSEDIESLALPNPPWWLHNYTVESMIPLRALCQLDPIRAPGFPDDIKCLLVDKAGRNRPEQVWAKLLRQTQEGIFVCQVLNEPFQDFGIRELDLICVQVMEDEKGLFSVCLGKAETDGASEGPVASPLEN